MHIYRDLGTVEEIYAYEEVRNAASLAALGEFERACAAIEDFISSCTNESVRIFAMREAISWKEQMGLLGEAAADASECARKAVGKWGKRDERSLIVLNTELYRVSRAGFVKKAGTLARAALKLAEENLSDLDPLAHAIRNNAAHALALGGDCDYAGVIYRQLLEDYERWGKIESDEAMTTRDNYANFLMETRQFAEAVTVYRAQLAILTILWGPLSEAALHCRNDIATALHQGGASSDAYIMWHELSRDCEKTLKEGHELTIEVLTINVQHALSGQNHEAILDFSAKLIAHLDEAGQIENARSIRRLRNRHMEKGW